MLINMQTIFARFIAILMGIVAMFTGGNMENIKMELKNEVTTATETIEIQVFNYTGKKLTADESFSLEKNENGEWVKVNFSGDYAVKDIAVVIGNLQEAVFKINVAEAFGKTLAEGEYRLTKGFCADVNASVLFTVKPA